jgi:DNA-binding IclR family transcriptional regulator
MARSRETLAGVAMPKLGAADVDDRYVVPAVDRAMRLLTLLANARREMPLSEITRELKAPHATTLRLVYTLESHGALRRTPAGYEIGPRVLSWGFEYLSSQDVVTIARPGLARLSEETGVSANLAVLDRAEIIYLCHVAPLGSLTSRIEIGSRLPAHASSSGRVLLSGLTAEELGKLYSGLSLPRLPDTVDTIEGIIAQAEADRVQGWVVKKGVFTRDLVAIAAPVRNGGGGMVAAINISGPSTSIGEGAVQRERLDHLLNCAREISWRLGFQAR